MSARENISPEEFSGGQSVEDWLASDEGHEWQSGTFRAGYNIEPGRQQRYRGAEESNPFFSVADPVLSLHGHAAWPEPVDYQDLDNPRFHPRSS